jgi:hypothetical protein
MRLPKHTLQAARKLRGVQEKPPQHDHVLRAERRHFSQTADEFLFQKKELIKC